MKMESRVEVAVDPMTAFVAFTDEMDRWWGNGPIDAWDFSRAIGRRVEPGVGGRVLEVYATDALELGRVTVWEPGARVAWKSSVDDVTIDVWFEPHGAGTLVRVEGHVPEGGHAAAGLAVLRVTPEWLPRYFARGRQPWPALDRLILIVRYARPAAAGRWLCEAFGFEPTRDIPDDESTGPSWLELRAGTSVIVLEQVEGEISGSTHGVMLMVDDIQSHFERAERAGATIVQPIKTYGFTSYVASDPEGRQWTFFQANATS